MALVIPPTEIPDANKVDVDKLHQSVRTLLTHKAIPWQVQAKLARDGYVTMEDLADRWDTPENARNHSPQELEFQRNANITEAQEKFVAMRIYQCVRHAKSVVLNQPSASTGPLSQPKSTLAGAIDSLCDRKQLLKNWDDLVKLPRPKLEFQGSDAYLRKQWKYCSQGEIGWFQIKHIISALPEMDERPIKTKRQLTVNGWEREEEDEERKAPTTREQLKRAHTVFRNSLLMCIISFPQFAHFDAKYQDLEEWYSFFWGKDIADRKPQPSEMVLLYAERNAWRDIHNRVYEGATLKEAMTAQKADTLFWQREVYERLSKPDKGSGQPKGSGGQNPKGKGKVRPAWSPFQPQWSKGKQPQKGKTPKGSSKGKDNNWPKNWATQTPKGLQFCRDFLLRNKCPGNCGRSHGCPVIKDGWTCNGTHHPDQCPNK